MDCINALVTQNPCYLAGKVITPKGLMLHSVGCPQPSAAAFSKIWNRADANTCVHAVLQADGTVYQLLPWHWRAWHCGGSGNDTHIGVEMTEPAQIKYAGGATFVCTDVAAAREQVKGCYHTAVELFATLCKTYGLNPLTQICSHAEGYRRGIASNHGDPEHLWRQLGMTYTMDRFRNDVQAEMRGMTSEQTLKTALQMQFVREVQTAIGVCVDGIAGPITLRATPTISAAKNRTHHAVQPVQRYLYALGYVEVGTADGVAGFKFTQAVRNFQRDHGCTIDGEITANAKTWQTLLGI